LVNDASFLVVGSFDAGWSFMVPALAVMQFRLLAKGGA
jgi:hypothetical protein